MTKKIFILLANSDNSSFNGAICDHYENGAKSAGHEVRRMNIGDMKFDPILHKGYKQVQELEPDLKTFQENVRWCNHFLVVTPIWWSNIPAVFKGLIDRVWLPGFGFKFNKEKIGWQRLLKYKRARVIATSDSLPVILWILFGGNLNNFTRGVLRFSGFAPVRKNWISGMKNLNQKRAQKILKKFYNLGIKGI